MLEKKSQRNNTRLWYLELFLCLTILFWMVPYSHDEWAWGTHVGITHFREWFQGYNGRYFGDLISLVITRSLVVKTLFMSGTMVLLVHTVTSFIDVLGEGLGRELRGGAFGLLMLVPAGLFAQVYGWPAAFVNFVPPVIAVLWLLTLHLRGKLGQLSLTKQLSLGVLITLGTQFFSENISLFMVAFGLILIVDSLVARRGLTAFHVAVLATSVIGAVVMFINPAYSNAAANTDGYKKINTGIGYLIHKIYAVMIPDMFTNYAIILFLIAVLVGVLLWQDGGWRQWPTVCAFWLICAYPLYGMFFLNHMQFGSTGINGGLLIGFTIAYYLALMYLMLVCLDGVWRHAGIIVLLSLGGVSAPLLMADPIGPRSFYMTFVCWILIILIMLTALVTQFPTTVMLFKRVGNAIAMTMLLFYGLTFAYSYYGQLNRSQLIHTALAQHAKVIRLPELPNTQFTWKTSTNEPTWNARFKLFYHIPNDVKVIFPDAPDYTLYK